MLCLTSIQNNLSVLTSMRSFKFDDLQACVFLFLGANIFLEVP